MAKVRGWMTPFKSWLEVCFLCLGSGGLRGGELVVKSSAKATREPKHLQSGTQTKHPNLTSTHPGIHDPPISHHQTNNPALQSNATFKYGRTVMTTSLVGNMFPFASSIWVCSVHGLLTPEQNTNRCRSKSTPWLLVNTR